MEIFSHLEGRINNKDKYTEKTSKDTLDLIYQVADRLSIIIGSRYFLKAGSTVNLDEVEKTKLIEERTTIPTPKIIDYWNSNGTNFILFKNVEGINLNSVWCELEQEVKETIAKKVCEYIKEMRKIIQIDKVLIHGDLIPLNIIIDEKSKRIVAIVDWETSRYENEDEELRIMNKNPDSPPDWENLILRNLDMLSKEENKFVNEWKCSTCGYNNMTNVSLCQGEKDGKKCEKKKPGTV
jgi:aminoglycoside phosphotransferase (APT) family kinase protein